MLTNVSVRNEMKKIKRLKPKRGIRSRIISSLCVRKIHRQRKRMTTRISNTRRMIAGSGLVLLRTKEAPREKERVFYLSAETTIISTKMIPNCKRKPSRRAILTKSTMRSFLPTPHSNKRSRRRKAVLRPCARLKISRLTPRFTIIICRPTL